VHFVPSMLQAFIHEPGVQAAPASSASCSGACRWMQGKCSPSCPGRLFNLYGPTEAAIDVTHWTCVDEGADSVPIGRRSPTCTPTCSTPSSTRCRPASGELYLGGSGLARSYHRRAALTAERFVPSPFADGAAPVPHRRPRYRADGVIEYLGRSTIR
jgi:non-ribosomal peptide synthetase component F